MNAASRQPFLMPKEHGAYAEMAFPQVTALILSGAQLPAVLIAAAVTCAFLLFEPALVMAGRRGPRIRKQSGQRAKKQAIALASIAAACGLTGALLSPSPIWWALIAVAGLALAVVLVVVAGLERSVLGESTVAVTLAGAAVPTALAGGTPMTATSIQAGVWAAAFLLATITVNAVMDQHKSHGRRAAWMPVMASIAVGAAALWAAQFGGMYRAYLAVFPMIVTCDLVIFVRLTPHSLRWLGWSMVASNTATLIMLLVFLS